MTKKVKVSVSVTLFFEMECVLNVGKDYGLPIWKTTCFIQSGDCISIKIVCLLEWVSFSYKNT